MPVNAVSVVNIRMNAWKMKTLLTFDDLLTGFSIHILKLS